ncbi:MAG: peptidoglycan DD-metalloendopeptidase family protein [Myxococcales bacterium]|nr:peptidoglycan DD-metalloendopeptidase family protein [Myxococcales bacterium]
MIWMMAITAPAQELEAFAYEPAGSLVDGSGEGRDDEMIFLPGMRFPLEAAPAYLNSQVYGHGGSEGPAGGQCHENNYSYPWRDNYCESRRFSMPLCPAGTGHQGQDIRPATCDRDQHWAVATVAGTIARIGSFSVSLISDDGTQHRYLHLEPSSLEVAVGDQVARGERLGRVSNAFFGSDGERVPTTTHLHYDVQMNLDGRNVFVPPYASLVSAYQSLLMSPESRCDPVPRRGRTIEETEGCVEWFGPPRFWRKEARETASDGSLFWTNAHAGASPANFARYGLQLQARGTYTVEVFVGEGRNRATQVAYTVRHGGEEDVVVVDQSAAEGWTRLGAFDFAEGGDQWVQISDNTGEEGRDLHLTADALRLTRGR